MASIGESVGLAKPVLSHLTMRIENRDFGAVRLHQLLQRFLLLQF